MVDILDGLWHHIDEGVKEMVDRIVAHYAECVRKQIENMDAMGLARIKANGKIWCDIKLHDGIVERYGSVNECTVSSVEYLKLIWTYGSEDANMIVKSFYDADAVLVKGLCKAFYESGMDAIEVFSIYGRQRDILIRPIYQRKEEETLDCNVIK